MELAKTKHERATGSKVGKSRKTEKRRGKKSEKKGGRGTAGREI